MTNEELQPYRASGWIAGVTALLAAVFAGVMIVTGQPTYALRAGGIVPLLAAMAICGLVDPRRLYALSKPEMQNDPSMKRSGVVIMLIGFATSAAIIIGYLLR